MDAIIGLLFLVGAIVSFVGSIMVLIKAFQESILWGLGSLLIPFVILVFVLLNWYEAKQGFLTMLAGAAVTILGLILGAMFGEPVAPPQM